jgi:hypothetical protein
VDVIGSIPVGPTKENPVAAGQQAGCDGVFLLFRWLLRFLLPQ